ncbi:PH domain-containing protein [Oligoflexia bacterium]|nr:PH domain-containing protein [Oligoflexia bacterium]
MESAVNNVSNFNLKERYPISFALVLRSNLNAFSFFVLLFVLLGVVLFSVYKAESGWLVDAREFILLKKIIIISLAAIFVLVKFIYHLIYWLRYDYFIDNGRLYIETGIIIRDEACVPMTFFSEFYLEQGWIDLLFGTKDLIMKTALGEGQEVARIEALKEADAKALRNLLISLSSAPEIGPTQKAL